MNFYRPLHYISGEYVFTTDASSFSRFSALMVQNGFNFWGTRYEEGNVLFCVSVFSAERVYNLSSAASVPIEIVAKKGLPFVFSRYRKRYGMLLGLVVGLFLLFWSQLFAWKITVSGNVGIKTEEIERALAECGISVGCFIPKIDTVNDSNRLLMNCRGLSSAALSINGTHIYLSVLERKDIPEIYNSNGFFNVVASRDGVIIDVNAADGTPEVNEGDVVYEGELLINSFIAGKNGSFRPTHARGKVYAAVSESFDIEIPLSRVTKNITGNTQTRCIYTVLGKEMPRLSDDESDYEYFDAVVTERTVKLFGFIELPIKEKRIFYSEYIPIKRDISESDAEKYAYGELDALIAEVDLELLSCESYCITDKEKGVCKLVANAVFKQDIAKEVPFEILNYSISERLESALE
ncbi:MAG: sporulation protein YqfD [Clostridia bacterium]|nr:sporulation protein YqfD [Clostridia bacterium]